MAETPAKRKEAIAPLRVAGYVRVSTSKQVEEGLSFEEQARRVRAAAEARGGRVAELFEEAGVSGRKDTRPALDRLLERLDDYDMVIVPKLDRLGRSARHLLELYARFEEAGVALVVIEPPIDTSTPSGRLLRTVLAAVAEFESEMIGERTASVREARARGGHYMGSTPPFGYRLAEGGGIEPDPATRAVVERIFRDFAAGVSQKQLARALARDTGDAWRQNKIARILQNPVYIGRVSYRGAEYAGLHEPLIDLALWERAQALRSARAALSGAGRGRRPKGAHLFTQGLLRCAHCGYAMAPRTDTAGRESYVCLGRVQNGPEFCPQRQIPRAALDEAAFAYFQAVALDVEAAQAELEAQLRARTTEARLLLDDAERDTTRVAESIARVRRDYAEGRINAAEWRELKGPLIEEQSAAQTRATLLRDRLAELESDDLATRAREEAVRRVAELRAAVAGEVASAEGLEDVRAQLLRLFERFDVGRTDIPPDPSMPPEMIAAREAALRDARAEQLTAGGGTWVVLPWPRPGVIDPLDLEWRLPLAEAGASTPFPSDRNTRPGSWPGLSWPGFATM